MGTLTEEEAATAPDEAMGVRTEGGTWNRVWQPCVCLMFAET